MVSEYGYDMPSVAFSRRIEEWTVRGEPRRSGVNGELVLAPEELRHVEAVDLKNGLKAECAFYGTDSAEAAVSELPEEYFDADGPVGPIGFHWANGQLFVEVLYVGEWPENGDETAHVEQLTELVGPLLRQSGSTLHSIDVIDSWSGPTVLGVELRISVPWRGSRLQICLRSARTRFVCVRRSGRRPSRATRSPI
jgi:hypothetical protein